MGCLTLEITHCLGFNNLKMSNFIPVIHFVLWSYLLPVLSISSFTPFFFNHNFMSLSTGLIIEQWANCSSEPHPEVATATILFYA